MEDFKVMQLKSLFHIDLTHLVKESKAEGFRFLERLVNDYEMALIDLIILGNLYMVCLTKKVY
ncbi:acetyltransferase, GNAT family [Cytobacillus firmus]|uniref:Acetyltransferase, GNAT family n=1 Tax=Cytobacillus firmus TaxID=1399 RepID=A0A800MSF8_CYTFI|nr:acetyltransferase, GNAT family [Cytobacillus firmus]